MESEINGFKLPDWIRLAGPKSIRFPGISMRKVEMMAKDIEEVTGVEMRIYKSCDRCRCELPVHVKGLDCIKCYITYDLCNECRKEAEPLICPLGFGCREDVVKK